MFRQWKVILVSSLLLMFALCACQADKAEKVSYYLIPREVVLIDRDGIGQLLALSDKVTGVVGDEVLEIISGHCQDGRFIFECRDLSFVDTATLEFMEREIDGLVAHDRSELIFNDAAFAEEGYTDDVLAEQPMRLIVNDRLADGVMLMMHNVQAVDELDELGQVVTHDGVSVLCIWDEDGKGVLITAMSDDGRYGRAEVQKVTAYDKDGDVYDLTPALRASAWRQYIVFPEALWGNIATLVLDDMLIRYVQTVADEPQILEVELPKGQTVGDVVSGKKQMIGPYEVEITSYILQDDRVYLNMEVEQGDDDCYLQHFYTQTCDGRYGSGDIQQNKRFFVLSAEQKNLQDNKLSLPIALYNVMQKGQWVVDVP